MALLCHVANINILKDLLNYTFSSPQSYHKVKENTRVKWNDNKSLFEYQNECNVIFRPACKLEYNGTCVGKVCWSSKVSIKFQFFIEFSKSLTNIWINSKKKENLQICHSFNRKQKLTLNSRCFQIRVSTRLSSTLQHPSTSKLKYFLFNAINRI